MEVKSTFQNSISEGPDLKDSPTATKALLPTIRPELLDLSFAQINTSSIWSPLVQDGSGVLHISAWKAQRTYGI